MSRRLLLERLHALFQAAPLAVFLSMAACSADATTPPPLADERGGEEGESAAASEALGAVGQRIKADVVAIDQPYVYNRFGAFNPAGMIYALKRDVVPINPSAPVGPGNAMLRKGKRPRPLVLRVNVGDTLVITFTNWLAPTREGAPEPGGEEAPSDSPATRRASIHINGLSPLDLASLGGNVGQNPSALAAPGETRVYAFRAEHEGGFLMHSAGAMSGGQGDGGQVVQGLFGSVNVEPRGAFWLRSQVTAKDLAAATRGRNPDGTPQIDYDAELDGVPVLRIASDEGEIVHGDLNAIIAGYEETTVGTPTSVDQGHFREFTVVFHDEINAVQAFPRLEEDPSFHGVRDGFAINYGAAGMGAELLANRKRVGPTRDCVECKFEDFFLTSWANGDPAMNVVKNANGAATEALFPDDPSNVHHAYLGDPTRFRNLHAGPKETHVFHLHGHQWRQTPNDADSNYLDSQTIGPGEAFTYDINYGGAGNRSISVGDAIFHCHLYPHFAQGMWGLFRSHDVFEAGTADRNLPDGEIAQGTPNPAVVPIPGRGMPPMPTYAPTTVTVGNTHLQRPAMPGYPFYIAAEAGHRPSQPPLDIEHDGGLPRHLVTSVPEGGATFGVRGEFDVELNRANLKLLPQEGTPPERVAMRFHAGELPGAVPFTTLYGFPARAYPAFTPEGDPSRFVVNGQKPQPGAPYSDPCPAGAPRRDYRVAFVQIDGTVNKAGWHDPQMRIEVLEEDFEATRSQARPPEPLFVRARSGECVSFSTTNTIPGALQPDDFQIFTPTDMMGQHIHLVKFDVTSSDGGANGFNYEDGTFAPDEVVARIDAANALGGAFVADGDIDEGGARAPLMAKAHPRLPGAPLGAQTTVQRWFADAVLNREMQDLTVRTSFTHDHFSPSSHQHHGFYGALVVEPAGSVWRDPVTGVTFPSGARGDGGPTSFRADILTVDPQQSFREFNLSFADFAIVYDAFGRPVNPPNAREAPLPIAIEHDERPAPEVISARDPGTELINYRNEPIPLRIAERRADGTFVQRAGAAGEMNNVFRSSVHGDPFTPILNIYDNDPVQIRLIQGAQEEQHLFSVHANRWLNEPAEPDSGYSNGEPIGISEHKEFVFQGNPIATKNADGSADYLYESAPTDDLWNGMWGILRAQGKRVVGLAPLPGREPPAVARAPKLACPVSAPERIYTVHAIHAKDLPEQRLTYNKKFDLWDPDAILFVEESLLPNVTAGKRRPEPLILRAAAGDCIKVTLVNDLPTPLPEKQPHWSYLPPITEHFNVNQVRASNHVSLHPQLVTYDVNQNDGANIGNNAVQTVAPGQRRTYTWYAGILKLRPNGTEERTPVEFGAINLKSMADVVNHGMHGAVGTLIVEPPDATWKIDQGTRAQATVTFKGVGGDLESFREFVAMYQDDLGLHTNREEFQCTDPELNCGTAIRNIFAVDDAEDSGGKGFNYRTEPLWARLGLPPETPEQTINDLDLSSILSSAVHGDPETPIFTAPVGARMRVRVLHPSGHRRQHAFTLWGSEWPNRPWRLGSASTRIGFNPESFARGAEGGISAQRAVNILPYFGAGGPFGVKGDFLYRDQPSYQFPSGLWGILRVTSP